jgi:NAD+ synthase
MLQLVPSVLAFDCKKHSPEIEKFIRDTMLQLGRDGILVPISGGLDSSVVVSLCVRAVGKDKVTGIMLPEKKGNPDAMDYAQLMAKSLGIRTVIIDISDILKPIGTYEFITNRLGSTRFQKSFVKNVLPDITRNLFIQGIQGKGKPIVRRGMASMYSKHRIRFVVAYKFAEEHNLLEVGCAHKSEDLLGLFSKFGVDDNADVMPLKNLYRTQILQLAQFINVPEEIIQRTPNPDMLPGIEDKYLDVLGIDSETVDLVLFGLEKGLTASNIASELNLTADKVKEIQELVKSTTHMRNHSLSPEFGV